MKKLIFLILFSIISFAQNNSIVMIKRQYDFQNKQNQYNINSMLRIVLENCNYEVIYDDIELTKTQAENMCSFLSANLVEKSTMFKTTLKLQLIDCYKKVIFETAEVTSTEKEYQVIYTDLMRKLQPELKKRIIEKPKNIEVPQNNTEVFDVVEIPAQVDYLMKANKSGFELFATTNKTAKSDFNAYNTTNPNVFITTKNYRFGVILKDKNTYSFQYYDNFNLVVEQLSIKL